MRVAATFLLWAAIGHALAWAARRLLPLAAAYDILAGGPLRGLALLALAYWTRRYWLPRLARTIGQARLPRP